MISMVVENWFIMEREDFYVYEYAKLKTYMLRLPILLTFEILQDAASLNVLLQTKIYHGIIKHIFPDQILLNIIIKKKQYWEITETATRNFRRISKTYFMNINKSYDHEFTVKAIVLYIEFFPLYSTLYTYTCSITPVT